MKCDALASILKAHALWLSANGMLDRAEAIANLGDALRAHTSAHYGKVLDGAESRLRAGSAVPSADFALSVGDLRAAAQFCEAVQPKTAAPLRDLAAMLERAKPSRSDFEAAILAALNKPSAKQEPIDHALAQKLADQLTSANAVPERFAALLATIASDKSISKATANDIANRFLGLQLNRPSKAAAIKKIEERHRLDLLNDSRARAIERVAV
jgi:hypothetical protein